MSETTIEPLASRIRPQCLEEFVGQEHLTGVGKPIRVAMEKGRLFSFILWGPPGVGKTTLVRIYANTLQVNLVELSAVSAGKDDIRKMVNERKQEQPIVLFVDEMHRFNKAQQDYLLPFVESGTIVFLGATTENPSFEIIPALRSRCRVFVLNELSADALRQILVRAEGFLGVTLDAEAQDWLIAMSGGDARVALTVLEMAVNLYKTPTLAHLKDAAQLKQLRYDKKGEEHYNTISAFIKSLRASEADAALYYLARMIEGGEDPLFIARRMVIFASEDVGLAQPTALVVANAVFRACETIGYPECALHLGHGAAYLARCKKDRSIYHALSLAQKDVREHGNLPIPMRLRNTTTRLMGELGYDVDDEVHPIEDLMPKGLRGRKYFKKNF